MTRKTYCGNLLWQSGLTLLVPDWLLIYRIFEEKLVLSLTRTGSHSDLF